MDGQLSVSGIAAVAGVSPRTVRFYHSAGVLPEPPRDASGYRRYGGKEVIELVRIVRLRALGMSLPQIAQRVAGDEAADVSLSEALDRLADELDTEIDRLVASRDRLRELARSETFDHPERALAQALQDQGVLGPADDLGSGEKWAAAVLDAVHPDGMPGVLAQAGRLLGDPKVRAALRPLRRRVGRLGADSTDAEIRALAEEVAALLRDGIEGLDGGIDGVGGRTVDVALVDVLLTDRLRPTQQRFLHELRRLLQESR